jgi:hypothetical protein
LPTLAHSLQGNLIYPCGYTGGAKDRQSAPASFEANEVSLSSQIGITQIEKDKEFQMENADKCMNLSNLLSDEAMDHVKKMCGPGYILDGGKPVPIEPEAEGSSQAKGPGFFIQPNSLTPGTGVEGFFGDNAKLCEDDLAYICKVINDPFHLTFTSSAFPTISLRPLLCTSLYPSFKRMPSPPLLSLHVARLLRTTKERSRQPV